MEVLTDARKNNILLNLLANGKGSLDYAKNLVKYGGGGNGEVPPVPEGRPNWCVCGICRVMSTEEENKCCGKLRCVTSFVTFQNTCTAQNLSQRKIYQTIPCARLIGQSNQKIRNVTHQRYR